MDANPRLLNLLARYAQYDQLTLALAGVALAAVLIGFSFHRTGGSQTRPDKILSQIYFAFLLLAFILTLAGAAYSSLTGGNL